MNTIESHAPLLGLSQRLPPSNLAAEQALLGALLANNKAYERISDFLVAEHFADPIHGRVYTAIARRVEVGQLADAITLKAEFEHSGLLDEVGGTPYLAQLLSAMVGIINAGEYGRAIYDAWVRRQLIDIGETVVNNAFGATPELDGTGQVEAAEQSLFDLAVRGNADGGFIPFATALTRAIDAAASAFEHAGGVSGLSTGLRDLDKKTGGLHKSDLIILGGRPGMGKSALATKIAFGAARAIVADATRDDPNAVPKSSVAMFSLEMSAEQLATRLLSEESRISGDRIRRGDIGQKEFDQFVRVSREISALPLHIDDTAAITLSAMRTRCRRLMRTKGLSLVIVDYLQLMRPAAGARDENRVQQISQITQGLKALAKELNIPVIALSQLSRQVESREDKRPQLADLRESGSIEQDADIVMFIYREAYYLGRAEPKEGTAEHLIWQEKLDPIKNLAEVIIGKQRHGPIGVVRLHFNEDLTKFSNMAREGRYEVR